MDVYQENYNAIILICKFLHYAFWSKIEYMKTSSIEQAILELFNEKNCHMCAQEVYQHLQPHFAAVNPSTIYRALERMAQHGQVSIADLGTGTAVEKVTDHMHHHLVCQKCGTVQTIENEMVGTFFTQVDSQYDFKVNTNHLILFGECSVCKKAKE
jgi:Fur family transcriptional regulator, ferric uptake regulator